MAENNAPAHEPRITQYDTENLAVIDHYFTCKINEVEKPYMITVKFASIQEVLECAVKQVAVRVGQRMRVSASGKGKGKPYVFPSRERHEAGIAVNAAGDFHKTIDDEVAENPEKFRRDTIERLKALARKNGQELTPAMLEMLTGAIQPAAAQPATIPPATNPTRPPVKEKEKGGNTRRNVAV